MKKFNKHRSRHFGRSFHNGFSLIEILIAITLFAIVAIISTQGLTSSLRSSRKSEAISRTREDVDNAMSAMERLLRNAQNIDEDTSTVNELFYEDEYGTVTSFTCDTTGGYIASGSARLTSEAVFVKCAESHFQFPVNAPGVPEAVIIKLVAEDANQSGSEGSVVTAESKVLLRNYTGL